MSKGLYLAFVFAALMLLARCEDSPRYSVSDITGVWLDIKVEFNKDPASENLPQQVERLRLAFTEFFDSPVFYMFTVYHADEIPRPQAVDSALNRLKTGIDSRDSIGFYRSVLEIDTAVEMLQRIDAGMAAKSQIHYFLLFFFFSMLIIVIILSMRFLNSMLEKSENREKQTLLFSRETITAQENERKRIARELHDTVLQDMWRLSFQINNEEIAKEQRAIMQKIRNICDTLIPADFKRRGLKNALEGLFYNFWLRSAVEYHITIQEGLCFDILNYDTQLQCYRIIQECLSNIEKHSFAKKAALVIRTLSPRGLQQDDGLLLISISDDGRGFSPPARESFDSLRTEGHFGIWSIYERAAYIQAALKIESSAGKGTVISLEIPFNGNGGVN